MKNWIRCIKIKVKWMKEKKLFTSWIHLSRYNPQGHYLIKFRLVECFVKSNGKQRRKKSLGGLNGFFVNLYRQNSIENDMQFFLCMCILHLITCSRIYKRTEISEIMLFTQFCLAVFLFFFFREINFSWCTRPTVEHYSQKYFRYKTLCTYQLFTAHSISVKLIFMF